MRVIVATLLLLMASPVVAGAAESNEATRSPWDVTLGGRFIYTSGYTTWNTQAASGSPNILSELTWRGVDSPVTEIHAEAIWRQRLVLQGAFGVGPISDGAFIDNDFGADDRQNRFSSTRSGVTGDVLVYFNVDVGARLFSWKQPQSPVLGFLDAFVGYQYWYEAYEASGATGTTAISPGAVVVREKFQFQSIRLGAQAKVPLYQGLALRVSGAYLPWTRSDLEDEHPLRTDLRHDPSFKAKAEGGKGYQLEGALSYELPNRLSIEAGFRYWRIESGDGTFTARTTSGDVNSNLNEIIVERYGPWAGVSYRF